MDKRIPRYVNAYVSNYVVNFTKMEFYVCCAEVL